MRTRPRRPVRFVLLLLLGACARAGVETGTPAPCAAAAEARWRVPPGQEIREVGVYMDEAAQPFDGWSTYGRRRLRAAMAAWNALRLPARFVEAAAARDAGVVVNVVERVPAGAGGREAEQAGVTNLAIAGGGIIRANVFVAVAAPYGVRFSLAAQQANLLHELGHALGLPHTAANTAVMSERRAGATLTGADIALARAHYGVCQRR